MTRKTFLLAFCAAALALTLAEPTFAVKQPNILLIFSDDHATQAISAYGEKRRLIETPNIDRLAKEGMRFDRCLVPNALCAPSRASILTGKYSHLNGVYNHNTRHRFDGFQQTFPKLLQGVGYQTAVVGKWHLVSDPTGFDYWHILPGQGLYYNPPMIRNGERVKHEGYVTDIITDLSIEWLKTRDKSRPFLLMSQHKAPHREWAPALRHLGHDNDRQYPEPENLFDDYAGRGLAVRDQDMTLEKSFTPLDAKFKTPPNMTPEQIKIWNEYYRPRNEAFQKANLSGKELVRWRYNRYMHDYLACVKAIDENVGRLLDFLKVEGLERDTIVIYASDQGFFLGEHGWYDKRFIFEESLRTPFLLRWPGMVKPRQKTEDIVSVIDFPSTFLHAAGVPIPRDMQGASLLPLFDGTTPQNWRTSFYYHFYEYFGPHRVRPHYGVVTDRYKLVHFYTPDVDYWELYDLKKDPREMQNVYRNAKYKPVAAKLHQELERLRKELKVPDEEPDEVFGRRAQQNSPQPPPRPRS